MTGVTKAVVCVILSANQKEYPMWQQRVSSLAI